MNKIAIVGTGLIGTSLGLALKKLNLRDTRIVGVDLERSRARKAQKMGALDKAEGSIVQAVSEANIVFIATPVMAIKEVLELIGPRISEGCLVTDTGGTKRVVLEWAQKYLPNKADFVGGHPMAGKETSGPEGAEATFFQGRVYCIVPALGASTQGVRALVDLIAAMGARPYFIGAQEHDSFVGAVSHLPFLLSAALVKCTSSSPQWDDIARLASSGFKDVTRLASGDAVMHRDVCLTNSEGIIYWVDQFIAELQSIKSVLRKEDNDHELHALFDHCYEEREKWLAGITTASVKLEQEKYRTTSAGRTTAQLLFGTRIADRILGFENEDENREKKAR